jgi:hypothetical protein
MNHNTIIDTSHASYSRRFHNQYSLEDGEAIERQVSMLDKLSWQRLDHVEEDE